MKCLNINTSCGAYRKYQGGGSGSPICFPTDDLIQYLSVRNEYTFVDAIATNDAELTQSYALGFDRDSRNGIKTNTIIEGQTSIDCKVGVLFYDLVKGSTIISSTTPSGSASDNGFTLITGIGVDAVLALQVFNGGGASFDNVIFPGLDINAEVYHDIEFHWDGKNTPTGDTYATNAWVELNDGTRVYGDTPITHSWDGLSTHHLHVGMFEDQDNLDNNYNLHGYIAYIKVSVNDSELCNTPMAIGYGDIIYCVTSGDKYYARNVKQEQWVKQPYYHHNIKGVSKYNQLYFNNSGSSLNYVKMSRFRIPNIENFKLRFRTKLENIGTTSQLLWAEDNSHLPNKHEAFITLGADGSVTVTLNNIGNDFAGVILQSSHGAYAFGQWNDIIISRRNDDTLYLEVVNEFNSSIDSTNWYQTGLMLIDGTDEVYYGFDKGGYVSTLNPKTPRGIFSDVAQWYEWDDDMDSEDPMYHSVCTDILWEKEGISIVLDNSLSNDDPEEGVYYIPMLETNTALDVHGNTLSNPENVLGHNNCESTVTQPDVAILKTADTDFVWFNNPSQLYFNSDGDRLSYGVVRFNHGHFHVKSDFILDVLDEQSFLIAGRDGGGGNEFNVLVSSDNKVFVSTYNTTTSNYIVTHLSPYVLSANIRYKVEAFADGRNSYIKVYEITNRVKLVSASIVPIVRTWDMYSYNTYCYVAGYGSSNLNGVLNSLSYILDYLGTNLIEVAIGDEIHDTGVHTRISEVISTKTIAIAPKDIPFAELPVNVGNYALGYKSGNKISNRWLLYNPPVLDSQLDVIYACFVPGWLPSTTYNVIDSTDDVKDSGDNVIHTIEYPNPLKD